MRARRFAFVAVIAVAGLPVGGVFAWREGIRARARAHEATALADVAAERQRSPDHRPVLAGAVRPGNVTPSLVAALESIPSEPFTASLPQNLGAPVAAIRSAIQAEVVSGAWDPTAARPLAPLPAVVGFRSLDPPTRRSELARACHAASVGFDWATSARSDPREWVGAAESAGLAVELGRFQDDVIRCGVLGPSESTLERALYWGPADLLEEHIGGLRPDDLAALADQLAKLDATGPPLDRLLAMQRHERILDFLERADEPVEPPDTRWLVGLGRELAVLRAFEDRSTPRVLALFAEYEAACAGPLDEVRARIDEAWRSRFSEGATPSPCYNTPRTAGVYVLLERATRLRAARVAALARRYELLTRRRPESLDEILGRAPGPLERAPTDGRPFRIRVPREQGLVVWARNLPGRPSRREDAALEVVGKGEVGFAWPRR